MGRLRSLRSSLPLVIGVPLAAALVLTLGAAAPAAPHHAGRQQGGMLVLTPVTGSPIDVPVSSFSFVVEQVLNSGSPSSGAGAGKVTFNPFSVITQPDANTPTLFKILAEGQHFKMATLTIPTQGGGSETIAFGLVALQTMSLSGGNGPGANGSGANGPGGNSEVLDFEYGALNLAYSASAGAAPQTSFGWNRVKNQPTSGSPAS